MKTIWKAWLLAALAGVCIPHGMAAAAAEPAKEDALWLLHFLQEKRPSGIYGDLAQMEEAARMLPQAAAEEEKDNGIDAAGTVVNRDGFYAAQDKAAGEGTYNALTKDGLWVGGADDDTGFHVDNAGRVYGTAGAEITGADSYGTVNRLSVSPDGALMQSRYDQADVTGAVEVSGGSVWISSTKGDTDESWLSLSPDSFVLTQISSGRENKDYYTYVNSQNGELTLGVEVKSEEEKPEGTGNRANLLHASEYEIGMSAEDESGNGSFIGARTGLAWFGSKAGDGAYSQIRSAPDELLLEAKGADGGRSGRVEIAEDQVSLGVRQGTDAFGGISLSPDQGSFMIYGEGDTDGLGLRIVRQASFSRTELSSIQSGLSLMTGQVLLKTTDPKGAPENLFVMKNTDTAGNGGISLARISGSSFHGLGILDDQVLLGYGLAPDGSVGDKSAAITFGKEGITLSGPVAMKGQKLTGLAAGTDASDAVNYGQLQAFYTGGSLTVGNETYGGAHFTVGSSGGVFLKGGSGSGAFAINLQNASAIMDAVEEAGVDTVKEAIRNLKETSPQPARASFSLASVRSSLLAEDTEVRVPAGGGLINGDHAAGDFTVGKDLTVKGDAAIEGTATMKDAVVTGDLVLGTGEQAIHVGDRIESNTAAIEQNRTAVVNLGRRVDRLDGEIDSVGAVSAALAGLHPMDYDGTQSKYQIAAATGAYDGTYALALGGFYHVSEDVMLSFGLSSALNGENKTAGNLGAVFRVGRGPSEAEKALRKSGLGDTLLKRLAAMDDKIAALEERNSRLEAENERQKEQLAAQQKQIDAMAER